MSKDADKKKLLQRYYRVVLSYVDLKHALLSAQQLLKLGNDYEPENNVLKTALYCSMIVAYARPFNSGGQSNIGNIPVLGQEMINLLSKSEKEIHKYCLLCRNKMIAHTDANYVNLDPFLAINIPGDIVVPLKNDALAPFTVSYTQDFKKLCKKQVEWVVNERMKIEPEILSLLRKSNLSDGFK